MIYKLNVLVPLVNLMGYLWILWGCIGLYYGDGYYAIERTGVGILFFILAELKRIKGYTYGIANGESE